MVKELRSSKTIAIELLSSSFAELTVFSEICLLTWLTLSSRRDALRVGRVCQDDLRGGVRTICKACCVCRVVSRSGTFRLPVSEVC